MLSLFPGLDFLGIAFGIEGYCVVHGPDPVWGSRIQDWVPPAGRFDGIIGGPPCQVHSEMRFLNLRSGSGVGDMVPEFVRCILAAVPEWFLMENVPTATPPKVPGYQIVKRVVQALDVPSEGGWIGAEARRKRAFWFGFRNPAQRVFGRFYIEKSVVRIEPSRVKSAVLAGHGPAIGQRRNGITTLPLPEAARLQGLDPSLLPGLPYRAEALRKLIGNGVPVALGRAVARGVIRATVGDFRPGIG